MVVFLDRSRMEGQLPKAGAVSVQVKVVGQEMKVKPVRVAIDCSVLFLGISAISAISDIISGES